MNSETSDYAIQATNLTRFYGVKRGVQDLDWKVPRGTILGLLGENGCGKTTLLKLAMGMLVPDNGTITTLGVDPALMPPSVRARIGWLSDQLAVPNHFTLETSMALQRSYFPTWNNKLATDLAATFGLSKASVFAKLSLGQKRRFMLLLVIAQMPELLVLDEPAGGLDPAVRRQLIDILVEQATERPMTIVLSSHIMSDVERLVDHVAFMKDGHIHTQDGLENMRMRIKRICVQSPAAVQVIKERFHVLQVDERPDVTRLVVSDYAPEKVTGSDYTVEHLNLEELFLVHNEPAHKETVAQ